MRETTVQVPRSVKKEQEEVLQQLEQRFPAACGDNLGEAGCPPAACGGGSHAEEGVCTQRRL